MKLFLTTVMLAGYVLGCASLRIQRTDSTLSKTGKVAARVPLALMSFGLSEVQYECARRRPDLSWDQCGDRVARAAAAGMLAEQQRQEQQREQAEARRQQCQTFCQSSPYGDTVSCQTTCE